MKVAICISGYLRKYNEIFHTFKKNILLPILDSGHSYDIFISTYNELNSQNSFGAKQGDVNDCGQLDIENILDIYCPKYILLGNFNELKHQFHIHNFDKELNLHKILLNIHDNGVLFGLSMHYQRYLANKLKIRHEEKNNSKYDFVLMTRADLFWLKPIDFNKLDPNKLTCREIGYDYFFLSSSENIDKVANLWLNVQSICDRAQRKNVKDLPLYCPEYFLEYYLEEVGFNHERRAVLGEDSCLIYPRKNFDTMLYGVLSKYKRLNELDSL